MVKSPIKLGFIAEGATEKSVLEFSDFFKYLKSLKIDYVPDVVDAEGNCNLLPHNLTQYIKTLEDKGANKIIILTDLDKDICFTKTKERITENKPFSHIITISVKEIEAWFLADTEAIREYINEPTFTCIDPESIDDPYEEIKKLRMQNVGRGPGSKIILARTIIVNHKFFIQNAAKHDKCNSAKYFLKSVSQFA